MKFRIAIVAGLAAAVAAGLPLGAQEHGGGPKPELQSWSFAGPFGKYDTNQLQRGFQVFSQVCANCHGAELLAFRNLSEEGGPHYTEEQIRLLASQYVVVDPNDPLSDRPAVPSDPWPDPFPSLADARAANNGVAPPDFSVIAKARSVPFDFPYWIFNYFTAYQEGGPDYIYNLLLGYHDEAPEGVTLAPGQHYNDFFPGHLLAMPRPLFDGLVDYDGEDFPETTEQYAKDVSAFLMWVADPHLGARKEIGFRVMAFLILFTVLMYLTYRRVWKGVAH